MNKTLSDWNYIFGNKILALEKNDRSQAGAMLQIIPPRQDWREFLGCVKDHWFEWRGDNRYPFCLLVLFGGVAFYEYSSGKYWDYFSEAVGADFNRQKLVQNFAAVISENNLKLLRRDSGTDYVGSAVFQIGIPLSLWNNFLEFCQWILRIDEWEGFNDEEWKLRIESRFPNQKRLQNFLLGNRQAAAEFVRIVLEARRLLHAEPDLNFLELPQRKLLRDEYFDEVPETVDFLFPQNSKAREILFESRPYLFWYDEHARIELHLPAAPRHQLSKTVWRFGDITEKASANAHSIIVNGAAFQNDLSLILETDNQIEKKDLRGLAPFGLHDGKRFINPRRDVFPIDSYTLISPKKLEDFHWQGFDAEEYCPNELYELEDKTRCYVTRLFPIGKTPSVSFTADGEKFRLKFRRRSKIEAYFFVGENSQAAQFSRSFDSEVIKIGHLPLVCVALPKEENNESFLESYFQVKLDEEEKLRAFGKWEKRYEDDIRDYFTWDWDKAQAVGKSFSTQTFRRTDVANPFAMLKTVRENYIPPDLTGKHKIFLKADKLGMSFCQEIEIVAPPAQIEKCWQDLPGDFLPFFLLCQKPEGMSWDEILLAKDVIAPDAPDFSEWHLRRYAKFGYLPQNGKLWQIAESRSCISASENNVCRVRFVGNPALLWSLYAEIVRKHPRLLKEKKIIKIGKPILYALPPIKAVSDDKFSCLEMNWRSDEKYKFLKNEIRGFFNKSGVKITDNLWNK